MIQIKTQRRKVGMTAQFASVAALLVATSVTLPSARAQQADQPADKPTDSDLLKELETDLLKDLPAASKGAPDQAGRQLLEDLKAGEDLGSVPENPLLEIGRKMRNVEERIVRRDTSEQTQSAQGAIVSALEKLIEQAKKQGGDGSQGAAGKGSGKAGVGDGDATPRPPQDSTDRVGKPQADPANPTDMRNLLERIWGHLPEKKRDEMQNAISDRFLPKYEKLIEEYYKRLAEERSTGP